MVLQQTIENLRDRPREERQTIAFNISIGVVAILFIAWIFYFLHSADSLAISNVPDNYQDAVASVQQAVDQTGWVSTTAQESQSFPPVQQGVSAPEGIQLIEEGTAPTGSIEASQ